MDYKERVESARKLRDETNHFLNDFAGQDGQLRISSKYANTAIHYNGSAVITIYYQADSILLRHKTRALCNAVCHTLREEGISCKDESNLGSMVISVDARDARTALAKIIAGLRSGELTVRNAEPGRAGTEVGTAKEEPAQAQPRKNETGSEAEPNDMQEEKQEDLAASLPPDGESEMPRAEASDQSATGREGNGIFQTENQSDNSGKTGKMLFCSDVRLGAVSMERLDTIQSHKWQAARNAKFADMVDKAAQNNASYIALFGRLFGSDRVAESVIDTLFQAVSENREIKVLAFLDVGEFMRISYRNDVPDNLRLFNMQADDSYGDDSIALRIVDNTAELRLGSNASVQIKRDDAGRFIICRMPKIRMIPSFEPIGFDDARDMECGYGILEWTDEWVGQYRVMNAPGYAFRAIELKILPEDDQTEIIRKLNNAVRGIGPDTFLRFTVTGRSAFGIVMSGDALKNQLQGRIFFVEVYDNTVMDIDEKSFETDISLRSEFVRLALQDESLSESERNRVISCGWNALNGREVSAE